METTDIILLIVSGLGMFGADKSFMMYVGVGEVTPMVRLAAWILKVEPFYEKTGLSFRKKSGNEFIPKQKVLAVSAGLKIALRSLIISVFPITGGLISAFLL